MTQATQIDYDALAKQAGAISSQPPQQGAAVDYDALAKQAGAISSSRPDFAANPPGVQRPPNPILNPITGTGAGARDIRGFSERMNDPNPGSAEGANLAEGLGEWVKAGPGQTVQGYRDIAQGKGARGQRELISGAGNAMVPLLPFLAAAAPVATGVTMATGAAGQYGGQKVAEGLGASPEGAGLAGDITGLVTGYGGAKASSILPWMRARVQAPLGDVPTKPRGTVPADAASPVELKAYADQHGIPLNAGQATEHNLPRNLQSAGERATIGGTAVKQQIQASQAAIAQHGQDLMDSFSPNTPDLATAGDTIQRGVGQALEREQSQSRQAYAAIDQQASGTGVNLAPLKQTAQQILQDSSFVRKAGALDQRRAASILQDIGKLPDSGSFTQAQQLRSALLDESRSPDLAISNRAQGWLKQLTASVDSEMMTAAQSKPGLEASFREANDHWQQLQDDFNNPRSPLAQILQEPDPSKVPQKLMQRGQIGGSPYNAQLLDRYGIDKGPVKWAVTGDMMQKNFGLYNGGKTLGGYSDDFLRSMFSPEELSAIYKTGAIARSVRLNTNPSGTAAVTGAMEDVRHPIMSLAPKAMAAKLTNSPTFNRRMMTPGQAQGPSSPVPKALLPFLQGLGNRQK